MPFAGNADPAAVVHGLFRRGDSGDEASPEALIRAANFAAAIEAMALTVEGRAREIERMNIDGAASDAVRTLESQAANLHKAANTLRDARGRREVGIAFSAAHAATINFPASNHAMQAGLHETGHGEQKALPAVAAAKATYMVTPGEIQRRAMDFVQHTVKAEKRAVYAAYAKDPRYTLYQAVPTPGDMVRHFKETAQRVDDSAFTATQKRTVSAVRTTAVEAQISAFNVTDGSIDEAAIRVASAALGGQFGDDFSKINGQSVESFLKETRTARGFMPVPEERVTQYLHEISDLKGKGRLNEMQKADLDMYQRAVSQAQVANKYFEAQEQLRLVMTDRAARRLILVQESMSQLQGLPEEAINVHLQEAWNSLEGMRDGLEVREEDERMATSILKAKSADIVPHSEVEPADIPVSQNSLFEIEEAANAIRWHMGDAMEVSMADPLPMQLLPLKRTVMAGVGFPSFA